MRFTKKEVEALVEALDVGVPEVLQAAEYATEPEHKDDLFNKAHCADQIKNKLKISRSGSVELLLEYKDATQNSMYFI